MLVVASLAFGIAFVSLLVLLSGPARRVALDRPNERSLHAVPTPRTGGLAIAAGVGAALALAGSAEHGPLAIALLLAAVSFGDDVLGLPVLLRLAIHLAAVAGLLALVWPDAGPMVFLFLLLGIVWLINLYNFMDGSDGLAGGMTVIGFGACAFAAQSAGVPWLATACVAVASAALAFLLFNFPPARIFMGDSGSIPLGFLAGAVGVCGWQAGAWAPWFPVLVFSPFVADATLTLAKRLARGDKVWQAHREHYYQRLVRMGFGQRKTALAEYLLMAGCAGVALAVREASLALQAAMLATGAACYAALALWIDARWARHSAENVR